MVGKDIVLSVEGLETSFFDPEGRQAKAVDGLSFTVRRNETVALVGESGCGKSITALSILRLVPSPPGRITGGRVMLEGRDLLTVQDREIRQVRGNDIAMVFQEPMTSLNPVFTVGDQIAEAILAHERISRRAAFKRAEEMLDLVRIPDPSKRLHEFPHRLSGGMRQRVMIAMALSCRPKLLIADEPTTALDVTVQAQVLALMKSLQREFGMGLILITHDLGVVAETADRVIVMYAGTKVEEAPVRTLFGAPLHPYTKGLMKATPHAERAARAATDRLQEIPGLVPSLWDMPAGCPFQPRCEAAIDGCAERRPPLEGFGDDHRAACFAAAAELAP